MAHAAVFHCPFCGDDALYPHAGEAGGWECRSCCRAFGVQFHGLTSHHLRVEDGPDEGSAAGSESLAGGQA